MWASCCSEAEVWREENEREGGERMMDREKERGGRLKGEDIEKNC